MNTIAPAVPARDSRVLRDVESLVRDFFLEQFSERPRLLTLEYSGDSIHVHGYRPVALAEMKLVASVEKAAKLQQYHRELFKTAEKELHRKLLRFFNGTMGAVTCSFDPAAHEFDITIELAGFAWTGQTTRPQPYA